MPPQAGLVIARNARAQKTVVSLSVVMNAIPLSVLLNIAPRNRVYVRATFIEYLHRSSTTFQRSPSSPSSPSPSDLSFVTDISRRRHPPPVSREQRQTAALRKIPTVSGQTEADGETDSMTTTTTTTALIAHSTKNNGRRKGRKERNGERKLQREND